MTVTFINLFEVPPGRDDAFRAMWGEVNTYMRAQPGYISHTLHRAVESDAKHRFANVVLWESAEAWQAAHDEGFRKLAGAPDWKEFPRVPTLYEVVDQAEA